MVSPVTAFRFTKSELDELDRLGTEFLCNRTDVLRYAVRALRDAADTRSEITAYSRARTFVQNLRTQYGEDAVLKLDDSVDPSWTLDGAPVDSEVLTPIIKRQGDRFVLHLLDPETGVGIRNVDSWEDEEQVRHAVVALKDLWVHSQFGPIGQPQTRQLRDGRPVVKIEEDDGSVRYLAVGNDGSTTEIDPVPEPVSTIAPSVDVGVRREMARRPGPNLGAGLGGKIMLSGNLEQDRQDVISTLQMLLNRANNGGLDDLLTVDSPAENSVVLGG